MGSRQAKPDAALRRLAQGLYPWRGRARWGKLLSGPCGPGTVRPARARDFIAQEAPVEDPIAGTSRFANAIAARGPRDHSGRSLREADRFSTMSPRSSPGPWSDCWS